MHSQSVKQAQPPVQNITQKGQYHRFLLLLLLYTKWSIKRMIIPSTKPRFIDSKKLKKNKENRNLQAVIVWWWRSVHQTILFRERIMCVSNCTFLRIGRAQWNPMTNVAAGVWSQLNAFQRWRRRVRKWLFFSFRATISHSSLHHTEKPTQIPGPACR